MTSRVRRAVSNMRVNSSAHIVLQEANRESAARSRDKRLKLIADLEVEVQQLKRQHAEFKVQPLM